MILPPKLISSFIAKFAVTSAARRSARFVKLAYHSWKSIGLYEPAIPTAYRLPTSYSFIPLFLPIASYKSPLLSILLPSRASKAKPVKVRPSIS